MAVPEVVANIKARYAQFVQGSRRTAAELEKQRRQLRRNQRAIQQYNDRVRQGIQSLKQWSSVAAGAAVFSLGAAAREAAMLGEELQLLSVRGRISLNDVQAYAKVFAADLDNVSEAILTFVESVGEAWVEPDAERGQFFREIGLQLEDAQGKIRPTTDLLDEMLQRLAAMEDVGRREAIARPIFGEEDAKALLAAATRPDFEQRLAAFRADERKAKAEQIEGLARVRGEYHATAMEFKTSMLRVFGDLEDPISNMLTKLREAAPILEAGFKGALDRVVEIIGKLGQLTPAGLGGTPREAEERGRQVVDFVTDILLAVILLAVASYHGIGRVIRVGKWAYNAYKASKVSSKSGNIGELGKFGRKALQGAGGFAGAAWLKDLLMSEDEPTGQPHGPTGQPPLFPKPEYTMRANNTQEQLEEWIKTQGINAADLKGGEKAQVSPSRALNFQRAVVISPELARELNERVAQPGPVPATELLSNIRFASPPIRLSAIWDCTSRRGYPRRQTTHYRPRAYDRSYNSA